MCHHPVFDAVCASALTDPVPHCSKKKMVREGGEDGLGWVTTRSPVHIGIACACTLMPPLSRAKVALELCFTTQVACP